MESLLIWKVVGYRFNYGFRYFKKKITFGHIEVISKGINWLYFPLLSVFININILGEIVLIQSIISIVTTIIQFGQNRVILRFSSNKDRDAFFVSLLLISFSFLFLLLVFFIFNFKKHGELIVCVTYLIVLNNTFCLEARARNDIKSFLILRVSHVTVRIVVGLMAFSLLSSPYAYLLGDILGVLISFFIYFIFKSKNNKKIKYIKKNNILKYFYFGFPIFIQAVLTSSSGNIDRFLLNYYGYNNDLGDFGIIITISTAVTFIISFFSMNYEVKIYHENSLKNALLLAREFRVKAFYYSISIYPILLLSYYILSLLNATINTDYFSFTILFLSSMLMIRFFELSYIYAYQERSKLILLLSTVMILVLIIMDFIFVPYFGVIGASVAKLCSVCSVFFFKVKE